MTWTQEQAPWRPRIGALCRDAAIERARLIASALRADGSGSPDWAVQATSSLVGLLRWSDAPDRNEIARRLAVAGDPHEVVAALAEVVRRLPRASGAASVALEDLSAFAAAVATAVADEVPGTVSVDVPPHRPGVVTWSQARSLVDVLGQVVRAAVRLGVPNGGAVRVQFEPTPPAIVIVVSDRAHRTAEVVAASDERTHVLAAASARMASIGGELVHGGGPWGGMAVTIRLPAAAPVRKPRWREGV